MTTEITREIALAQGVTARVEHGELVVKGSKGEVRRSFTHPKVKIHIQDEKIILTSDRNTRRERTILGSFESHIKNIVQGVQELHIYKLKVCSGHFPMSVVVTGKEFVIKNFLGETVPRKVTLPQNVEVKVAGADITVSSPDVEAAGLAASKIERLCRITNRDLRIFQDGCYIVEKPGR